MGISRDHSGRGSTVNRRGLLIVLKEQKNKKQSKQWMMNYSTISIKLINIWLSLARIGYQYTNCWTEKEPPA